MWLAWDTAIFWAIHRGLHHPWLDPVMRALTDPGLLKIPLLVLLGGFLFTRGRRGVVGAVILALTLTASDQLSSKVMKPVFKRSRPSVMLRESRPLFGVRRTNSFPSGHATNFFAAAPVLAYIIPEARIASYVVAGAVSFSRVYVGDHWPSDVLGGTILGLFLGFLGRTAAARTERTLRGRFRAAGAEPSGARSGRRHGGGSKTGQAGKRYTQARSRFCRIRRRPWRARRRSLAEDPGRIDRSGGVEIRR